MNQTKRCTLKMIGFEMRNVTGNPFVHIFGIAFPIFMSIMICRVVAGQITDPNILKVVQTQILLSMSTIIPLATIFMGYACQYSMEVEKEIPLRMKLFGYRETTTILNKIIAEIIFMTIAFTIYFIIMFLIFPIEKPAISGVIIFIISIYILSGILFVLSHSIASLIKKFGATYAIVMVIYFAMMILGGMMGMEISSMPKAMQIISKMLPFYYFKEDMISIWKAEGYNYMPMIQSYLFLGAISGLLLFITFQKNNRKK